MGKKDDRQSKGVAKASSAQAAEYLASRGATGLGFGGFTGAAPLGAGAGGFAFGAGLTSTISAAAGKAAATSDAPLSADLDGEIAQCLRHLSKKDATTKLKALQTLRVLIKTKDAASLALALGPWTFLYAKLSQDTHRSVRTESAVVLGELVSGTGKAAASHVKSLLPLWWLAQFDPNADAANAASSAYQTCFPGKKRTDAIRYCLSEILDHLTDQATSNAQQLGDARKDTPEEMEDRYERVVSASLLALTNLLPALAAPADDPATAKVWSAVAQLLSKPGYVKSTAENKSPLIRGALYTLLRETAAAARRARDATPASAGSESSGDGDEGLGAAVRAADSKDVAGVVLGAVGEKDPGTHGAMWTMLLTYVKAFPDCWQHINLRKKFLPRLTELLRHGCYGSHSTSWPALLPLVSLMPRTLLEPSPDVPIQILEATWRGCLDPSASRAGRNEGIKAYAEVLQWLLLVVAPHVEAALSATQATPGSAAPAAPAAAGDPAEAAEAADTYRVLILQGTLRAHIVPATLGVVQKLPGVAPEAAKDLLLQLLRHLALAAHKAGAADTPAGRALRAVQEVTAESAAAEMRGAVAATAPAAPRDAPYSNTEGLIVSFRELDGVCEGVPSTAGVVCAAVTAALVHSMRTGEGEQGSAAAPQLPAAASQLLASLIRSNPNALTAQSDTAASAGPSPAVPHALDLQSLLRSCLHGPAGSSANMAHTQLLLSWLLGSQNAEAEWMETVRTLSGLTLPDVVVSDSSVLHEPAADTEGLKRVLQLASALADSITVRESQDGTDPDDPDSTTTNTNTMPTPHEEPWHRALDTLATRLCQIDLPAAADAAAWAHEEVGENVKALLEQPAVALLAALLGSGGMHALLVTQGCAQRAVQVLLDLVGAPNAAASGAADAVLTPASAAALAVARALLAPGSRASAGAELPSRRAIFAAAGSQVLALLTRIAYLAWVHDNNTAAFGQQHTRSLVSRTSLRTDGTVSDSDTSQGSSIGHSDGEGEGDYAQGGDSHSHAHKLALAVATKAWSQGHALRTAASSLSTADTAAAVAALVAALLRWLECGGGGGGSGGGRTAQDRRAATAGAQVQCMASIPELRCVVLSTVLSQTAACLAQVLVTNQLSASQLSPRQSTRGGSSALHGPLRSYLLFLAHLVRALGPHPFVHQGKDSDANALRPEGLLVSLLAAGCQAHGTRQRHAATATGSTTVYARFCQQRPAYVIASAVEQLVGCLLSTTDGGAAALHAALALAYTGATAAPAGAADAPPAHLAYPQSAYGDILIALAGHLAKQQNEYPHRVRDSFEYLIANHLLPAARDATAAAALPPAILGPLLRQTYSVLRGTAAEAEYATLSAPELTASYIQLSNSKPPITLEPLQGSVDLVKAANGCFPIAWQQQGQPAAGGSGRLSRGSERLAQPAAAASSQQQSQQLMCSTAPERKGLLQLFKHQCVRRGALAAAQRHASSPDLAGSAASSATAATARLSCAAAAYAAGDMQEAEWHTLLTDAETCLSQSVSVVRQLGTTLASTIQDIATDIIGGASASQDQPAAPVSLQIAVQLLRQLNQKGLLAQHPAYPTLQAAVGSALDSVQLSSGLEPVMVTVQVLLAQLQESASKRTDLLPAGIALFQQKYRMQFGEVCGKMMRLLLSIGFVNTLCSTCGHDTREDFWAWMAGAAGAWTAAGAATCGFLDLSTRAGGAGLASAALDALADTDTWLTQASTSMSSVDALVSLALGEPAGAGAGAGAVECRSRLAAAAYMALLHASDAVLSRLSVPVSQDGDNKDELPEYVQGTDVVNYLIHSGLHPQLASAIGLPADSVPVPTRLSAWALLLCHLASAGSAAVGVRFALGDVGSLAPEFLNSLLQWLPLEDYSGGKAAAAAKRAAEAAASAAASGDVRWQLRAAGAPGPDAAQLSRVARVLYAGALHALPASARTWFGDLRDRGTAVAVEAYTAAVVSPALIAAELQDVQSRGEELKGDEFQVRVNATSREVVAVLTVEEGSNLELAVKLPPSLPLKPPEVECRRRVGVSDTRMRKWLLSISAFLRTNNRGVGDAISMWRRNVESEFEGVEPCLICYSVIAATNSALPRHQCHTCGVKFHGGCLYKWFKTSGKSQCPHCQSTIDMR